VFLRFVLILQRKAVTPWGVTAGSIRFQGNVKSNEKGRAAILFLERKRIKKNFIWFLLSWNRPQNAVLRGSFLLILFFFKRKEWLLLPVPLGTSLYASA